MLTWEKLFQQANQKKDTIDGEDEGTADSRFLSYNCA